jgi:aspartyl-tRNA(Asn)/glutamyl-tRNA(Gln) amidotransferase subunit A
MAGERITPANAVPLSGLRFLVPQNVFLDDLDPIVAKDFEATLSALSSAGAKITNAHFKPLDLIRPLLNKGGFSASEAYAWHKELIAAKRTQYDSRVAARILMGEKQSAADYLELLKLRESAMTIYAMELSDFDAVLSPTCPILPPRETDLTDDKDFARLNMASLRNTLTINIFDGCSIALPMSAPDAPPTSLMVSGPAMADRRILGLAKSIEAVIPSRNT